MIMRQKEVVNPAKSLKYPIARELMRKNGYQVFEMTIFCSGSLLHNEFLNKFWPDTPDITASLVGLLGTQLYV